MEPSWYGFGMKARTGKSSSCFDPRRVTSTVDHDRDPLSTQAVNQAPRSLIQDADREPAERNASAFRSA
ncbi:MAG TPA: hypothetical protein RMH99_22820, partial [Sandaracinaceae bacterium LLY-WYZ-13_1]|nr:hypothetical protein [Sandaracinaceae bacterium LLY-WYZ-13_1]